MMDPIWGNAPKDLPSSPEMQANVLSQLFYSWVFPSLKAASREELTLSTIPTKPSKGERSWFAGRRLAFRIADAVVAFASWNRSPYIGQDVKLTSDPSSAGKLRWAGLLPRSSTPNALFVGVEWTSIPKAFTSPAESSPLCDGEYYGERLFFQEGGEKNDDNGGIAAAPPRCSFELATSIQFTNRSAPLPPSTVAPNAMTVVHSTYRAFLLLQCLPKLVADVAVLMMPLIAEYFILFLQRPDPVWSQGILIIACVFMLNLIQNLMMNLYSQLAVRTGILLRGSLTACVFEKAMIVSRTCLAHPDFGSGRVVNMVSNDIEKINQFWWTAMDMWSVPLQIVVAIGLLYRLVGWSGLVGISVLAFTIPLDSLILKKLNTFQASLSKVMDERIRNTVEMLSGIRVVKYMGWEEQFYLRIRSKRLQEIEWMRMVHWCRVGSSTINYATPRLVAALTVILYSVSGHDLQPQVIFPAISLLAILRVPFMNLPTLLTNYSQYSVAMERLTRFVCLDNAHNNVTASLPAEGNVAVQIDQVTLLAPSVKKLDPVVPRGSKKKGDDASPPTTAAYQVVGKPISSCRSTLSVTIPKGKLTVITGPTGCGKSSLLQAIGGQLGFSGSITTVAGGGPVVYVPQQPWIMNGTVRDNVVFFRDVHDAQLSQVLGACALVQEIDNMGGLHAEIGDRGVNLSGGQKARLSLARAALCSKTDKDVFLLDDIFAALDAQVCASIVKSCVCELMGQATRILVTHQDIAVRSADVVVAMRGDGSIGHVGDVASYRAYQQKEEQEELEKKKSSVDASAAASSSAPPAAGKAVAPPAGGHHAGMATASSAMEKVSKVREHVQASSRFFTQDTFTAFNILNVDSEDDDDDLLASKVTDVDDDRGTELTATSAHFSTTYYLSRAETTTTQQRLLLQESSRRKSQLATIEEKATGSVPWGAYLQHFRACGGVAVIVLVLLLFAVTEAVNCSGSVWLSIWIEKSYTLSDKEYLYVYMGVIGACLVTAPLRFFFALRALRYGSLNIHNGILKSVLSAPVAFFDTTPLGRIINRFTRDIGLFDISLQLNYLGLLQCLFFSASSAAIAIASQPIIAVVILPCAVVYYFLLVFYNRANREVRRMVNISTSPVMNVLNDVLTGGGTITTYGKGYAFMHRASDALDTTFSASQLQNACNRWLCVRVEVLGNVVITAVAAAGVVGKMHGFNVDNISLLSLGFTMTLSITQMLNLIVRQVAAVEADMNCVERLLFYTNNIEHEDLALMRTTQGGDASDGGGGSPSSAVIERQVPKRHPAVAPSAIDLSHASARYRLGLPLVLLNVSLHIKPGEKIGVVGRTGSGKSTLMMALLRIIDVAEGGCITIGKKPVRDMSLEDVRGTFSIIPQEPVLFEGTLRSNIDPFNDCSDVMIWKALELAGVKGRVSYDPQKLDMRVVFGGQNFSVGERQMLCLARALLKRGASCLLMDEATANVDASIDARVKETVRKAFRNHTVITIAHRLHTIADYDRIVVMHEGRVAEVGPPAELVEKENGMFRALISALGEEDERALLTAIRRVNDGATALENESSDEAYDEGNS